MKPVIKTKFVAALRSGNYQKGTGRLRKGAKFCVMGVLCNLHAKAHPKIAAEQHSADSYMGNAYRPSDAVCKWAGIGTQNSPEVTIKGKKATLMNQNDLMRRSFAEMADAIEAQL
jgi:hypothetical protein